MDYETAERTSTLYADQCSICATNAPAPAYIHKCSNQKLSQQLTCTKLRGRTRGTGCEVTIAIRGQETPILIGL